MKNFIRLTFLVVFVLFISSCDSDDDNGSSKQPLVGTWQIYEVNFFESFLVNGNEETSDESFLTENCDPIPFFSFDADGTLTFISFEIDLDEIGIDDASCVFVEQLSGTWSLINNNIYRLTVDNDPVEVEITFSNNNDNVDIIFDGSDEEGEFIVTYKATQI